MVDRNTIVGVDFVVAGFVLAALGYVAAASVSISAIGVDLTILGALILLIVPEAVPQDVYKALLSDSISNVEIILEETGLDERAFFVPLEGSEVRAFVPTNLSSQAEVSRYSSLELIQSVSKSSRRFVSSYGNEKGLLLVPPGNEIVHLSKVQEGDDLEDAIRSVIVSFSDLASGVLVGEREVNGSTSQVKISISNPKLASNSPFFKSSLGSPAACIVACVAAIALGKVVRILDEKTQGEKLLLTIEIME